jgi:hypothetical protein
MQFIASSGLLLIVLGLSGGAWHLWEKTEVALIPAGRYLIICGALLVTLTCICNYLKGCRIFQKDHFLDTRIWCTGLVLIFISDWLTRSWGLFKGPTIRGELIVGAIASYLLLGRSLWKSFFGAWPLIVAPLLIWSFYIALDGTLIFSDDHAVFLFRLKLLKENFPAIPFWSPLWNAGIDARDFFATGALNIFLLAAPLIYMFPTETIYPWLIAGVLWGLVPICVYAAARLLNLTPLASSISSVLSLCSGLFWFRWGLKYGTVGFITSTALFPLVVALAIRFIKAERPTWPSTTLMILASSAMLLWSPSGLAALPLAILALLHTPRLVKSKRHIIAVCLIVAINLPWMMVMWKVSNVGRFLNSNATVSTHQTTGTPEHEKISASSTSTYRHRSDGLNIKKAINHWQNNASALNPLIVVFAVPALIAFSGAGKLYITATCVWLFLLGTVGVSLKPQLELDRMIVIFSILVAIPIGQFMWRLFGYARAGLSWRITASCACAFLLVGPFAAASVVLNRSDDKYTILDREVRSFARTISNNSNGGRVFFSGCVLHELSGGHLAPLPFWTNTPMIASSYAHNIWRYEQPIPQELLARGDDGIREYLDLINATLVVAHEPVWIERFKNKPREFQQIWRGESFFIFKRLNYSPSYTASGAISDLTFTSNSINFIPQSDSVLLKFRHFPFVEATSCKITPERSAAGFNFISLTQCTPGSPVTIRSVPPLRRILGGVS